MSQEPTDDEIEDMLTTPLTRDKCPGCGSTAVRQVTGPRVVGVVMECDCGESWRPDDQSESAPPAPPGDAAATTWLPTPENINALPQPVRRYVHDLETRTDPAGEVAELTFLRDQNQQLLARIAADARDRDKLTAEVAFNREGWANWEKNAKDGWAAQEAASKREDEQRARADRLEAALCEQHQWHLNQTDHDDTIGESPAAAYSDSALCERTMAALAAKTPTPNTESK